MNKREIVRVGSLICGGCCIIIPHIFLIVFNTCDLLVNVCDFDINTQEYATILLTFLVIGSILIGIGVTITKNDEIKDDKKLIENIRKRGRTIKL